ncbi:MAG: hypothetical protein UT30_C0002G0030 [Candidatus Uhrbacteria bacterium GW2011_GWF2_39_13]|uniref:Uncharacterized protein n=1 Tax=Candidatus Uhrbacteria bacterium GW2011_GWF2_39_13 TaxID=1618995 RepID=A0A0G0MP56_9BACT|nr:MAG: hypothetical protein UT30_C0002G0030 [Candidatus Uhrbacteria bacterium GW2011_GWF2_39_13]HAU66118.1 hypothetical protein [Candidatus Uhrbacteria bacterium]
MNFDLKKRRKINRKGGDNNAASLDGADMENPCIDGVIAAIDAVLAETDPTTRDQRQRELDVIKHRCGCW